MGRKSNKSKDKKLKRKEENARIATKQAIVDLANAQKDPLEAFQPFKKYERNGLSVTVSCLLAENIDKETMDWAFQLTKENMQTLYEESEWGWSDKVKREEMEDPMAWHLIARDLSGSPVADVHFRFDLDNDDEVLYCYEIQLTKPARRKGLGKFLMQILELLAHKNHMTKVMCTVLKSNIDSKTFFVDKLKYEVDETSPEESMEEALFDEDGYTYQILSKAVGINRKVAPRVPSQAADVTKPASNGVTNGNATAAVN